MFRVLGEEFDSQFSSSLNVAAVVIDVVVSDYAVPRDMLFSMLDTERAAGAVQRISPVRHGESEGTKIEQVTAKLVAFFRLSRCGIFGNQVRQVGTEPRGKALQGTL